MTHFNDARLHGFRFPASKCCRPMASILWLEIGACWDPGPTDLALGARECVVHTLWDSE